VSPTVALESAFLTAVIDARENTEVEVVTIDIPGASLHATNDNYVVMRMNETLTDLMAKIDPKLYRKYLTDKKGKKVLYVHLQKALYKMMKSALLFYRKLISELKGMGFEVNPYDPCVVNKMVNGSQMMVRWHVDDLMISPSEAAPCPLQPCYFAKWDILANTLDYQYVMGFPVCICNHCLPIFRISCHRLMRE
jgi:hypothetical protein